MPTRRVVPLVISLGRPASEEISDKRLELFRWLAGKLTKDDCKLDPPVDSINLNFDDLNLEPEQIRAHVPRALFEQGANEVVVVDLSFNNYDILRDPFLYHLADSCRAVVDAAPDRLLAILLPALPPEGISIFWVPLNELTTPEEANRVVVVTNSGDYRWGGKKEGLGAAFQRDYTRKQRSLGLSPNERFQAKLLRKLGHFELMSGGESKCTRYFFDASLGIEELSSLLQDELRSIRREVKGPISLLAYGEPRSPWLVESAMLATIDLDIPLVTLPEVHQIDESAVPSTAAVLFVDFINTGGTLGLLARRLRALEAKIVPRSIAAMSILPKTTFRQDNITVKPLLKVDRQMMFRSDCPQCKLGIPYSDPWEEDYLVIRAFDFWDMMLSFKWKPETFGPKGEPFFQETPDLAGVFKRYGDWLAYKIDVILTYIGVRNEVVVVCPEEPIVSELVAKLRPRFEERLVAVQIPRDVLDLVGVGNGLAEIDWPRELKVTATGDRRPDGWLRQLSQLSLHGRLAQVVLIDEFNASGKTAKEMVLLLSEFGIQPMAYIPVINWQPNFKLGSIPVYPLYSLPRPRELIK